jgi:hypothetical protein
MLFVSISFILKFKKKKKKKKEHRNYGTYLSFGIYAADAGALLCIPYLNAAIFCASSRGKYIRLIWAPSKGLDCSGMFIETMQEIG